METNKSISVIPDWANGSKTDNELFVAAFSNSYKEMSLIGVLDKPRSKHVWCIVLHVSMPNQEDVYLYLRYIDGSALFTQAGTEDITKCAFWDKEQCLQTIDYIKSERSKRNPQAMGIVKAYNPYTMELINE